MKRLTEYEIIAGHVHAVPNDNKERSKTYLGIARAMAEQWAGPAEAALKGGDG